MRKTEDEKTGYNGEKKSWGRVCLLGYLSHGANTKLQLLLFLDPNMTLYIMFKHTL